MYRILAFIIFLIFLIPVSAQDIRVTGKVLDENGDAMPGVGIIDLSRPANGTVSDRDGAWSITVDRGDTLEFRT